MKIPIKVRIAIYGLTIAAFTSFGGMPLKTHQQPNTHPTVKIITPTASSNVTKTTVIRYHFSVSDKEDGESAYGEIATNEGFLKIKTFSSLQDFNKYDEKKASLEEKGYLTMAQYDCFNCHAMKSKLIAPSFKDISAKYTGKDLSQTVGNRIINGSQGIWGDMAMPAHPDIPPKKAKELVNWLLTYSPKSDLNFINGMKGVIRMSELKQKNASIISLKALYLDHGDEKTHSNRMWGYDNVILK